VPFHKENKDEDIMNGSPKNWNKADSVENLHYDGKDESAKPLINRVCIKMIIKIRSKRTR
jgi:hypothetical protein